MLQKITSEIFKLLSADDQKLFKADPADANSYLSVDGVDALLSAKEHEKSNRKTAEGRAKTAETELAALKAANTAAADKKARDSAKAKGDYDELIKLATEENVKLKADGEAAGKAANDRIATMLVDQQVTKITEPLFGKSAGLAEHAVRARLVGDAEKGAVSVLDAAGKPSSVTIEDFTKELAADPQYAAILVGSKGSGSGAGGNPGGGTPNKQWSDMDTDERIAAHNENPAAAEAAASAANQ